MCACFGFWKEAAARPQVAAGIYLNKLEGGPSASLEAACQTAATKPSWSSYRFARVLARGDLIMLRGCVVPFAKRGNVLAVHGVVAAERGNGCAGSSRVRASQACLRFLAAIGSNARTCWFQSSFVLDGQRQLRLWLWLLMPSTALLPFAPPSHIGNAPATAMTSMRRNGWVGVDLCTQLHGDVLASSMCWDFHFRRA